MAQYQINSSDAGKLVSEVATWEELQLTFRCTKTTLESVHRPLEPNAGKVETLERDDGGFVAKDRSDGTSNTHTVTPPNSRTPLRHAGSYLVADYEDELVSQDGDEFDVSYAFVRDEPRNTKSMALAQTGNWEFDVIEGVVGTDRVSARLQSRGDTGMDLWTVQGILSATQAEAMERSLSRLNGSRIREIADGGNRFVDNSQGRASFTLNSSPDTAVPTGDYSVESWQSERINDEYQRFEMTFGPFSST